MLEPYIIEEIRRREEERREQREQPRVDLPIDPFEPYPEASPVHEDRGVVIIETQWSFLFDTGRWRP